MTGERINPETLYASVQMGYSHAVKSKGKSTIHCSGQVAWDVNNKIVGEGDIGLQAQQVLANLRLVLHEAGAQVSDIVRLRTYVVNHEPSLLEPVGKAIAEFYGETIPAANTFHWRAIISTARVFD